MNTLQQEQNEPQLSAEMEKRLKEYFWHKLNWFFKNAEKGKDTIIRGKYSNDWHVMGTTSDILKEVATELATALEEENKKSHELGRMEAIEFYKHKAKRAYCEVCRVFIDADTGERKI